MSEDGGSSFRGEGAAENMIEYRVVEEAPEDGLIAGMPKAGVFITDHDHKRIWCPICGGEVTPGL